MIETKYTLSKLQVFHVDCCLAFKSLVDCYGRERKNILEFFSETLTLKPKYIGLFLQIFIG